MPLFISINFVRFTLHYSQNRRHRKLNFLTNSPSPQNIEEVFGLRLQDRRLIVATPDGFFVVGLTSGGFRETGLVYS